MSSRRNWPLLYATTGRGWSLEGGRLGAATVDRGVLELYGKVFVYDEPEFVLFAVLYPDGVSPFSHVPLYYEFLLLHRGPTPGPAAVVLKQWTLPGDGPLHGRLGYEAATRQAVVEVVGQTETGLRGPRFVERIDVGRALDAVPPTH